MSRRVSPVWLSAPFLAGVLLLVGIPLLAAVGLAFTDFSGVESPRWTGLDNLRRAADDDALRRALVSSAVVAAIAVPLRLLGVTALALLLHRPGRARLARTAVFLPTVIPDVAYALLWLWLLNPLYGPLTTGLIAVGLPSPDWLTDPWSARLGVALMLAFQIGEGFVIAMAWRRAIPRSIYEAALVDGAGAWFTMTRLTLPAMAPVLVLLALRDTVLTFSLSFVPAQLVTGGGPHEATVLLPLYVYRAAFQYFRLGYASAVSLVMLVMTAVVVAIQYRVARRWRLI